MRLKRFLLRYYPPGKYQNYVTDISGGSKKMSVISNLNHFCYLEDIEIKFG